MTILAMLTRLRQLCCHPALCYDDYTGGSCKLDTCMELLREAAETGHKVLLFSQFTSMLAILADALDREGLSYFLLQGSTSKEKRAAMVDSFNRDGTQVFLISLKAGGTGLNLTGADIVIHYDPWWNVAAQNQATVAPIASAKSIRCGVPPDGQGYPGGKNPAAAGKQAGTGGIGHPGGDRPAKPS